MSPSSAGKRNREQAKKDKAEAKRQRRQSAQAATDQRAPVAASGGIPTDELLHRIAEVHRLHDAGDMGDDEFEMARADLLGQLQVD